MLKRLQNSGKAQDTSEGSEDEPVRQTAGQFLREKREAFGYDLRDVSEQLRIRHVYLVAIEDDRLDDLPGATYAVGFVRAYAEYLGLNGPAIVERFKEETEELAKAARLVFPSPESEGKIPSGTILLLSVLVVAVVYGGWVFLSSRDRPIAELVPALPESFMKLIGKGETVPVEPETASPDTSDAASPSATAPQTAMPAVTPAPLQPVTVEVTREPETSEAVPEPETSSGPLQEPEKTVEPVVAATIATMPDNSAPAPVAATESIPQNTAAQGSLSETTPVDSAEADTAAPESPIVASAESVGVPTESEISAVSESVTDGSGADSASDSTAPAALDTAVAATGISDGSPPAAPETDNAAEQPAADVNVVALPAPPPPPAIVTDRPREYGIENTNSRVLLRASEEVWVQVRDDSGNLLLTRLLRKGDTYRVPNNPGLIMRTGNAGGLDILVDGAPIPRIGSKGTVLKDVALDADRLKAGTAAPQ